MDALVHFTLFQGDIEHAAHVTRATLAAQFGQADGQTWAAPDTGPLGNLASLVDAMLDPKVVLKAGLMFQGLGTPWTKNDSGVNILPFSGHA